MKVAIRITIAIAVVVFTLTMMVGCSDGKKAANGPVIMAIVPSCEGYTLGNYSNRFSGPTGKYSLALLAGIGKVVAGRGSPTEPNQVQYGFNIDQIASDTDAKPGSFIRRINPDSTGLYDLSTVGSYKATAYEIDGIGAIDLAECFITTDLASIWAPGIHIQSGPTAIAGPNWTQLWAKDGVVTVPFGTYVSFNINSGVVNSFIVHSLATGKTMDYVEGMSVAWPAGDYKFDVGVTRQGKRFDLTLVLRVTP
jgi:hypothetical protein